MLNKMKSRFLIGLGGLAVTCFIVTMGYTIGSQSVTNHTNKQIQTEAHKLLTKEKEKEKASVLSDELVKEFLTQYYTKEKLGENNNRIKPYMTDSAYKEEVAGQEEAINQVYKDYAGIYRDKSRCSICGCDLSKAHTTITKQNFDHIIPLQNRGNNDPSNWQLTCEHCNKSKGNRSDNFTNIVLPFWEI